MVIKAVIFDLGGVILQTVDPAPRERMAERFGTTRADLEYWMFASPTSLESEIGRLSDMLHICTVLDHFNQVGVEPIDAYHEFFSGDAVNQELLDYARSLKKDYKVAMLSNAWENARERLTRLFNFADVFDVIVFSAEAGTRKPEREIYDLMLGKLGVEPQEAVFTDDFIANVRGSKAAGIHTIQYQNNKDTIRSFNKLLAAS